jgi:hypothetical protein
VSTKVRTLRRRTKPSLAVRVRTFWVVALLALSVVFALALAAVNAPQLRPRSIDATVPPGSPVSKNTVLAAAHVDPDANLWLLDTGAVRRRLEAIPYVATAYVHRTQFPQPAVSLEVTLRKPTGCVRAASGTLTLDATERVLEARCASPDLPLVDIGAEAPAPPGEILTAPAIVRLLADAKTIGDRMPLRIVRRDRFGGLEAVDSRGVLLKFGADADLPAKLALVEPIRESAAHGRPVRVIDLRTPATPVVEFP